jgi:hypothetical protein
MLAAGGALWFLLLTALAAPAQEEAHPMTHQLPADPKAVVIQWRSEGGLAGEGFGPDLTVRADGTVTLGPRFGHGRAAQGRITDAELQDLLRFALDQNEFFAFDPAQVARQLEDSGAARAPSSPPGEALAVPAGPPYIDAGTTTVLIAADGRRHEVSYHGLFAAAREHPDSKPLAQLRAIELRLLDLAQQIAAAAGD